MLLTICVKRDDLFFCSTTTSSTYHLQYILLVRIANEWIVIVCKVLVEDKKIKDLTLGNKKTSSQVVPNRIISGIFVVRFLHNRKDGLF